ncbi:MAG TPA: Uma2 family endonuclease [Thermoanaerobaculia bacterium]
MAITIRDDRRWTREEYERCVEEGFFHPEARLELVYGFLYERSQHSPLHVTGVQCAWQFLRSLFDHEEGCFIQILAPLALGPDSEPEPDISVVPGRIRDYFSAHPTTAILIVEAAEDSLLHDRGLKKSLYAREGIPEYWLMNLIDNCLEVFRAPQDGVYTQSQILREEDTVSPLERPEASIKVADLLPFRRSQASKTPTPPTPTNI